MAGPAIQIEAFVLRRLPPSDSFQRLVLFDAEHGTVSVMHRVARKPRPDQVNVDLFDEVTGSVELARNSAGAGAGAATVISGAGAGIGGPGGMGSGPMWFVRELRVAARHEQIGHDYETLRRASAFATLVARNPVPQESRAAVFGLMRRAFAAFAKFAGPARETGGGAGPAVVYLKCLYSFARDEGYPVRQQWLATLSPELRESAALLLQTPLADLGGLDPARLCDGDVLVRRLAEYLRGHTELEVE
ncbi:hypothetical protein Ga0100231_020615 [Opitutaceae bacterium TAV4]|nr:hypothetical protein Ga0100231_020615 [Opitutaceae bacterium TAV4]RRK00450.1 hypothetical protein Ga0100230_021445 [Opitutaceae bacterium TAV3]